MTDVQVPLTQLSMATSPVARRRYTRWRIASLVAVHILIALHILHWQFAGTTLAPLELNEVMYTLEAGIVTAGAIFMGLALLSVLFFGRFFCSWACHLLALQDLCEWLLKRVGIKPPPIRSRVLAIAPFVLMGYMFLWPQLMRIWQGTAAPRLTVAGSDTWWASFVTDDFWRNLPGPGIAILTFIVCGGLIVYVMGSRSFCQTVCPYGAVFAIADRFSPGRIIARGDCSNCGRCTAVCSSHILVHDELSRFGKVVSPDCLKDLDCVQECPEQNLAFGFTRPPGVSVPVRARRSSSHRRFTWTEEGLTALSLVGGMLVFRGLYHTVPLLLAGAMAVLISIVAVMAWRMEGTVNLRLGQHTLRRNGRMTRAGIGFMVVVIAVSLFTAHSAVIRWHEFRIDASYEKLRDRAAAVTAGHGVFGHRDRALAEDALYRAEWCLQWGVYRPITRLVQTAMLLDLVGRADEAMPYLQEVRRRDPGSISVRVRLLEGYIVKRDAPRAREVLRELEAISRTTSRRPFALSDEMFDSLRTRIEVIAETPRHQ